jgi:hypothetical protein
MMKAKEIDMSGKNGQPLFLGIGRGLAPSAGAVAAGFDKALGEVAAERRGNFIVMKG